MQGNVLKKVLALIVAIIMVTTISVSAYDLIGWHLYLKSASFTWGDRLQTSGSVIRDAWEDAINDWDDACSANFYYNSSAISELNSNYEDSDDVFGSINVTRNYDDSLAYFFANINAGNIHIGEDNVARSAANHELGHALGLADIRSGRAIMNTRRDRNSIYKPQTDDLNGVAAIYGD